VFADEVADPPAECDPPEADRARVAEANAEAVRRGGVGELGRAEADSRGAAGAGSVIDERARLTGVRILYVVLVPVALVSFVRGVAVRIPTYLANPNLERGAQELGLPWPLLGYVIIGIATLASAVLIGVGALISRRLWHSSYGIYLALTAVLTGAALGPLAVLVHEDRDPLWRLVTAIVVAAATSAGLVFLYVFPNGVFVPAWSRWMAAAAVVYGPVSVRWTIPLVVDLVFLGSGFATQVYRYRRVSSPRERQQTTWVIYGLSMVVAAWLVQHLSPELVPELREPGAAHFVFTVTSDLLIFSSFAVLGTTVAVAILRERLLGIDLVVNRTLVYGGVSLLLAALFGALTLVGQRIAEATTGGRSDLVTLTTVVAIVLAFAPLRKRMKGLIDRFLPPREHLTLLFTDVVSSTEALVELGDERWRGTLGRYRGTVRSELKRFRAREVDTAGDGFFAAFDDATRAVQFALAIMAGLRGLGLQLRTGLHAGECEVRGETLTGINVHIAARVMAEAGSGEVLVSSAVRRLAAAASVEFEDRGTRRLKGVPTPVWLYAVSGGSSS